MRRAALCCALALLVGGCATSSEDAGTGEAAARIQVETFLRALADGDGEQACSKLSQGYRQDIGEPDCEAFMEQQAARRPLEFDGEPVNADSLDDLDFEVTVEGERATVTGPRGKQEIRLAKDPAAGWAIVEIEPLPLR